MLSGKGAGRRLVIFVTESLYVLMVVVTHALDQIFRIEFMWFRNSRQLPNLPNWHVTITVGVGGPNLFCIYICIEALDVNFESGATGKFKNSILHIFEIPDKVQVDIT